MLKRVVVAWSERVVLTVFCFVQSSYLQAASARRDASPGEIANKVVHKIRNDRIKPRRTASGFFNIDSPNAPRVPLSWHNGNLMLGQTHVYYIWYGNWSNVNAKNILTNLASSIDGSDYFSTNTSYYNSSKVPVTNSVTYNGSVDDAYSYGTSLTDSDVASIVTNAINGTDPTHQDGVLPFDQSGVYFVLTSADVNEVSGFCTQYCGWHNYKYKQLVVNGNSTTIKYAWVGDASTLCPSSCGVQSASPNGTPGADAMSSVIAHELEESVTDAYMNGWYTNWINPANGQSEMVENADDCAWTFGNNVAYTSVGSYYNITLNGVQYLVQQNWVNVPGGGGFCSMDTPYPAASVDATVMAPLDGTLRIFSTNSTGNPMTRTCVGLSCSAWYSLSGQLQGTEEASTWGGGRLDMFARGTDNALWHEYSLDGSTWSGYESLGGSITSNPASVSWGANRIDIFALGTSNNLMHLYYDNSWGGWESLGGVLASVPTAASWGAGRLDIFAKGTDNTLMHMYYDNAWSGWESLGGVLASAPTAVSWGPSRLDIFARGTDNTLIHFFYDGRWEYWESLGGSLAGTPSVTSTGPGTLDVVVLGPDSLYHELSYGSSGWGTWTVLPK